MGGIRLGRIEIVAYTACVSALLIILLGCIYYHKVLVKSEHTVTLKPPLWLNSSAAMAHFSILREAYWESRPSVAKHSLNPDVIARGKFQQQQISLFCRRHNLPSSFPTNLEDLTTLFQHLLYDDSKRLLFCYVPKTGCSNIKRLLLILNGILPPSSAVDKRPPESELRKANSLAALPPYEALYRIQHYYKMVVVRNPMIRLLSGFRNKIELPLNRSNWGKFPDGLKRDIVLGTRYDHNAVQMREEVFQNGSAVAPSFSEFLQYFANLSLSDYNEHFKPVLELCYPCVMQYNFYANFKVLDYDIYATLDYLGIPSSYYPRDIGHPQTPTNNYIKGYFSQVSPEVKKMISDTFASELDFYYSLYPEEAGMHRSL